MIRLPVPDKLDALESRALALLVDLARLIPVTDATADVVAINLVDRPPFAGLQDWRSAGWGIAPGAGEVRLARAALRCVDDVTSAASERRSTVRDRHGRVPSAENALVRESLEREPIVGQAATALRRATLAAAGRRPIRLAAPWPDGRRWAVALTHDLDVVTWWPAFTAMRIAELARKGQWRVAGRSAMEALGAVGRRPVQRGVRALLAAERAREVRSTWFVLCGTPTWRSIVAGDLTYRPESARTRSILRDIRADGHAVGLHGSFATVSAPERFREQRQRLAALTGLEINGVRQHFLRFLPTRTPRAMREGGFRYDSTWGFPDRNGFRLGVADVLPLQEEETPQTPPLAEIPVIWMDRALSKYRNVEDPNAWVADALHLAAAVRAVDGLWVGVWHPNLVGPLGFPGAPAAYVRLLEGLQEGNPFTGTLDEVVAWRHARARLRIDKVAPDGRLELSGAAHVPMEDPTR